MANLLQRKDYVGALKIALSLKQPHKSLGIFKELMRSECADEALNAVVQPLSTEELQGLLEYVASWNKNSRHSHTAHAVLASVLRCRQYEDLGRVPDIKSIVQSLLPYAERHLQRMNRLMQQSRLVDYTWQVMKLPDSRGVLRPSAMTQRKSKAEPAAAAMEVSTNGDAVKTPKSKKRKKRKPEPEAAETPESSKKPRRSRRKQKA